MPKSTKRFIFSTSGLNGQGFRMLSEGAVMEDFYNNPVMLFNHTRPEGTDKNQILPIGHWEDIELNGDNWSAVPVFDDKDEFAMSIYNKVEAGHIRMCSAGAEPLATSANPKDILAGQTKASVTKWRLKEISICDIGANPGALAVALYDSKDNLIRLSDKSIENLIPNIMAKTTTTAKAAAAKVAADKAKKELAVAKAKAIKLADDAEAAKLADDAEEPDAELTDGEDEPDGDEDKDATIAALKKQLADCQEQLKLAEEKMSLADAQQEDTKAEQLADKAIAMKKITLAQKPHIIKLAKTDYNGTVEYLNTIKSHTPVKDIIELADKSKTGDATKLETLSAKGWDELFKSSGDLNFIKLKAPEVYKAKFKEKFGKEPKNV
jgi:phage head maturation protease